MTHNRTLPTLAVAMLLTGGCSGAADTSAATTSPPAAPTAGSAAPVAASAAPSPTASPDPRLPTLSIADWTGAPDGGLPDVTFHLTEHCTYVTGAPGGPVTIVWPAGHAWIDPEKPGTVHLLEPQLNATVEVTDGQRVTFGGAQATHLRPYVTAPHPSCPTKSAFLAFQIN